MSFIPLKYRRNKLVSIGIRSSSLEFDDYVLEIKAEKNSYTSKILKNRCVIYLFRFRFTV